MRLLSFWCGLPKDGLHSGSTVKVLDDSGNTVEATFERNAGRRVVVTYTQGRHTGMGQYVKRERIVGKKAEPVFAHHKGWNQMKEVRKHITAAVVLTLATVGSALLYAGIVLVVSDNRAIASLVFLVTFALALSTAAKWLRKQTARQKRGTNPIPEAHMTVHGFIAHIKMHPELMPSGMTEYDLERFRKLCSGTDQAGIDQWVEQCRKRTYEQQS